VPKLGDLGGAGAWRPFRCGSEGAPLGRGREVLRLHMPQVIRILLADAEEDKPTRGRRDSPQTLEGVLAGVRQGGGRRLRSWQQPSRRREPLPGPSVSFLARSGSATRPLIAHIPWGGRLCGADCPDYLDSTHACGGRRADPEVCRM